MIWDRKQKRRTDEMTGGREPKLSEGQLSPEQKRIFDQIKSGPRGRVKGPLRVWLQSPQLAERAQRLGRFARYDSSLPPDLSELSILITARIWGSGYEWATHAPIAAKAGVADNVIQAISLGQTPKFQNEKQAAVFEFVVQLHRDRQVRDETYNAALKALGTTAVVDLVGICGYYTLISMTINTFEIPDGDGPKLPVLKCPTSDMFI